MRAKLGQRCCGLLLLSIGVHCTNAALPPGLREALAEFETGATRSTTCEGDFMIGRQKEISRFQILPAEWQRYSSSREYHNPNVAWKVAAKILAERQQAFEKSAQRECDFADIYLLWNAPGQYRRANWDRANVSRVVRERALRFANLMEERSRVYAAQNVAQN